MVIDYVNSIFSQHLTSTKRGQYSYRKMWPKGMSITYNKVYLWIQKKTTKQAKIISFLEAVELTYCNKTNSTPGVLAFALPMEIELLQLANQKHHQSFFNWLNNTVADAEMFTLGHGYGSSSPRCLWNMHDHEMHLIS